MTEDLAGKHVIVTGANSGIGKVTARELAGRGAHVILACRSLERARPVAEELHRDTGNAQIEVVELDLGDLESVRRCAQAVLAREQPIDRLINNAGITAGLRGEHRLSKQGFEPTFATNHLGHYLLTRLLLDRIVATPGARIVNVSSNSHYQARRLDWDALRAPPSKLGLREYAVSKLANVLFTRELARRLAGTGVSVFALNPGQVATNIWRRLPGPVRWWLERGMLTPEQGAFSTIHCATAPELANLSGRYFDAKGREKAPSRLAQDDELARALWARSAEWAGLPA